MENNTSSFLLMSRFAQDAEIFYSIQGEGQSMGIPSVFVRLANCNLYCQWCDTDYTWNWKGTNFVHKNDQNPTYQKFDKEKHSLRVPIAQVLSQMLSYGAKHFVLTGGEPFLQQNKLLALIESARDTQAGLFFEIETNATICPTRAFDQQIDQYNVSPKLSGAGVEKKHRIKDDVLRFFSTSPKAFFKFVIANENDVQELLELIEKFEIPKQRTFLMPEGTDAETLQKNGLFLVEVCKKYGFRYSERLHIHLFGAKAGV